MTNEERNTVRSWYFAMRLRHDLFQIIVAKDPRFVGDVVLAANPQTNTAYGTLDMMRTLSPAERDLLVILVKKWDKDFLRAARFMIVIRSNLKP